MALLERPAFSASSSWVSFVVRRYWRRRAPNDTSCDAIHSLLILVEEAITIVTHLQCSFPAVRDVVRGRLSRKGADKGDESIGIKLYWWPTTHRQASDWH